METIGGEGLGFRVSVGSRVSGLHPKPLNPLASKPRPAPSAAPVRRRPGQLRGLSGALWGGFGFRVQGSGFRVFRALGGFGLGAGGLGPWGLLPGGGGGGVRLGRFFVFCSFVFFFFFFFLGGGGL